MRPSLIVSVLVLLAVAPTGAAVPIVGRHDRPMTKFLELGEKFPSVCAVQQLASGTLVADRWILTAAHVAADPRVQRGSVRCGDQTLPVRRALLHPDARVEPGRPPDVDLALIELERPVTGIQPSGLYGGQNDDDEQGKSVVVVGYGDFGLAGEPRSRADRRRRAATNAIFDAGPRRLFIRFDAPPQATDLEGVGAAGDSGGPLFIERAGRHLLAGVSSASDGPVGAYGFVDIYTRVRTYREWIVSAIGAK